jgi:hypothetical protein
VVLVLREKGLGPVQAFRTGPKRAGIWVCANKKEGERRGEEKEERRGTNPKNTN